MSKIKQLNAVMFKNTRFLVFFSAACLIAAMAAPSGVMAQGERGAAPGDFDYYILTLSWSPTYCQSRSNQDNSDSYDRRDRYDRDGDRGYERENNSYRRGGSDEQQCNGGRPYAFVLHGLWPQYERRGWPEMCRTQERPWVPREIIDGMLDIMPSPKLVIQEYKKHGTCSGLSPRDYYDSARRVYRSIRIPERFADLSQPLTVSPEEVRQAFVDANPKLSADMIQVGCSRNLLRDVRICFTKDFAPRSCSQGEQNRNLCRSSSVTMPPVRGGGTGPRGGPSGI